jgi:hypothetical protein
MVKLTLKTDELNLIVSILESHLNDLNKLKPYINNTHLSVIRELYDKLNQIFLNSR